MMNAYEYYRLWRENVTDASLLQQLEAMDGNNQEIEDCFYRELEFGTGGLRGVLGVGSNRMNIYVVQKATQGYSNYLKQQVAAPRVAIAYDSRINSTLFAQTAASVFAANGIQVHIYKQLMPTPSLSFAVRDLQCDGGIVITASHNPGKYNGYKVYGADGCQITTEAATSILAQIDATNPFDDVKTVAFEEGLASGAIQYIGEETIAHYMAAMARTSVLPSGIAKDVSIVYTPLNGAGISCVPACLTENGFTNITLVEEQKNPDGNFPTCSYPNPEERAALTVGLEWAQKTGSDLLLATDPDCDRVGVAVKVEDSYQLISGNQMGVLLLDFVCKMHLNNGTMPVEPVAVKTIVTTPMASRVAEHYGVKLIDVLTGFKFIGEQIGLLEKAGEANRYIFGFEESYGYLSTAEVRDKDAVNASLLICEMFAYYKNEGKTLVQVLDELYAQYGYYREKLFSFTFEGAAGFDTMQAIMAAQRENPSMEILGVQVVAVRDYLRQITTFADGTTEEIVLPKSNVLRFELASGASAVLRPSGTEPKLKVYLSVAEVTAQESDQLLVELQNMYTEWVANFEVGK